MTRAKKPDTTPAGPSGETTQLPPQPIARELLAAIDDLATSRGVSRSALVRELLDRGLRAAGGSGVEPGLQDDLAAANRLRWRLDGALEELALPEPEASLICDAMNGTAEGVELAGGSIGPAWLYAEISDAIALAKLDKKWAVDGKALLRRLRALTPVQAAAVVEATRLFWRLTDVDTPVALRACGLVRNDSAPGG
jgi:hypothetical protein